MIRISEDREAPSMQMNICTGFRFQHLGFDEALLPACHGPAKGQRREDLVFFFEKYRDVSPNSSRLRPPTYNVRGG